MADNENRRDTSIQEKTRNKTVEPDRYKVILLNDDFTTQEFVIEVIVKVFQKDVVQATRIMREVHTKGSGIVGRYSYDIARTKVNEVHKMARERDFPLTCRIEKD